MAKEEKSVDISKFFTTSNEKEGCWIEPKIKGVGIGIEFKILGLSSDEVMIAADKYDKESEKIEKESDRIKKIKMGNEARIRRIASCIVDIRGKDGAKPLINGKPLEYSKEIVEEILLESPDIRDEILAASINTENFMTKKD